MIAENNNIMIFDERSKHFSAVAKHTDNSSNHKFSAGEATANSNLLEDEMHVENMLEDDMSIKIDGIHVNNFEEQKA